MTSSAPVPTPTPAGSSFHDLPLGPVFKFGGTSCGSTGRIARVADICVEKKPSAVVVSAMAGETNRLVALGRELSGRTDVPEYDLLVASGEQVSVALLSLALRERGVKPYPMLASHAGIRTDALFSKARIEGVDKSFILGKIAQGYLPVIAGFQGVTAEGQVTSLGRGGSDTSAVAIAAGIGARECVIYTDVDGVFTTDPRLCPKARIIRRISFEEMLEMASQGSKVLHIRSVHLAAKWGINLWVKNTFSNDEGTIMEGTPIEGEVVTGIAAAADETWYTLGPLKAAPDILAKVFGSLARRGVNVDIISQNLANAGASTDLTVHFTTGESEQATVKQVCGEVFPEAGLSFRSDVAKVSIVGIGMRSHPGVAARMFQALARASVDVLLVTTSEIKVACLIPRDRVKAAVQALHQEFLETE